MKRVTMPWILKFCYLLMLLSGAPIVSLTSAHTRPTGSVQQTQEGAEVLSSAQAERDGPEVLVQGSPIHNANGITFDRHDLLYIASLVGRSILVMNPDTGEILKRLGPPAMDVGDPDDLIFGPDGSLYWTAIITGEVRRLSPDGVQSAQQVGSGVNSITFSDNGRLFVSLCFRGPGAIYELDPKLSHPPRLIRNDLGPGCGLNGMAWHDGFLYGPRWFAGEVVRVNVDSGEMLTVANGLAAPAAVKFDSKGRLHVLDSARGEVLRVDIGTEKKQVVGQLRPGLDNMAFDSHDRLFVSSYAEGFIAEVLSSGQTRTISEGGLIAPGGVAIMTDHAGRERVFVADIFSVHEFNANTGEAGRTTVTFFGNVVGNPEIGDPLTASVDDDHLILSSWRANAVQVWDPEHNKIIEQDLDFAAPGNAIRFRGDLVVTELLTGSVVRRDAMTGAHVKLATGFILPIGLAATDQDLWVTDWVTGTVRKLVSSGVPLERPVVVAMGLLGPEGLAVEGSDSLLVVESLTGRLSRINLTTGEVSTVAEGLSIQREAPSWASPTWNFNGVAVSRTGEIYVTGDHKDVLYRIQPQ